MSYHDALNYLTQKTSVIELYDQWGGRVAICPEWNGRILTSTCDGLDGDSFGCINVRAIDTDRFEDFGGEDHWTTSPLIYPFAVEHVKENRAVLQRTLPMNDADGKHVELQLSRKISLLGRQKIGTEFGDTVADALEREDVSVVGFCSENTVQSQEKANIACRLRGMYNACPHTFVIVTIPSNEFSIKGFPVDVDYLGGSPHGRIRHLPEALLIRADGHGRCRTTMPYTAAPDIFGAVELRFGRLTLWTFDIPSNSEEDVIRIYNSGRRHSGEPDWVTYYEMNCFSAAKPLTPENPLLYRQCTLHISAGNDILEGLVQQIFGVSLGKFPKDVR
jgi:hypothetical protein